MAVTSSGNIVVKEDISVEDTEKELQTSKYNFTSCSAKADQPNFELLQYWPESLEENPVERILIQQPENCDGDTMKLEEQDDVVLQELVPYWPITDTVKIGMHMFSEHSEVKTEFEQELCAEKNLSESSTEIYKNSLLSIDAKSVTENFSKNYFHYNVENDVLPSTSEYNNLDRNGQCSNCNAKCECKCKTLKDAKPKCHTCDICNKSFTRRYRLVRHKLIHDKVKNFSCDTCSKSFQHTYSLTRHKLSHSDNKKYC